MFRLPQFRLIFDEKMVKTVKMEKWKNADFAKKAEFENATLCLIRKSRKFILLLNIVFLYFPKCHREFVFAPKNSSEIN